MAQKKQNATRAFSDLRTLSFALVLFRTLSLNHNYSAHGLKIRMIKVAPSFIQNGGGNEMEMETKVETILI